MSKSQQAAEERFDRDEDDYAALVVGFTEGWEAALPENPDPAVIEAMAEALHYGQGFDDWPVANESERNDAIDLARAAYAALRGAMQ